MCSVHVRNIRSNADLLNGEPVPLIAWIGLSGNLMSSFWPWHSVPCNVYNIWLSTLIYLTSTKLLLYNMFILPIMLYGSEFWTDNKAPEWICSTSQQQPSTSTSSLCQHQQPKTSLFHGQELSLETVPSLLPVWQCGTVCLSLSDQLRLLLVLSTS